jgi:hypothetical protein
MLGKTHLGALIPLLAVVVACSGSSSNPVAVHSPSASTVASPAATAQPASPVPSPLPGGGFATAQDAAVAAATAKTGYPFGPNTDPTYKGPYLVAGQTFGNTDPQAGLDAAMVALPIDNDGTNLCVVYVYYVASAWHAFPLLACPQVLGNSPIPGQEDHVFIIGGGCANVRQSPGLNGRVVACLKSGTQVQTDNINPRWADTHIWWSVNSQQGWMALDYLIAT